MSDIKIPQAIINFLENADFMSIATSGEDGQPSAANKFLLKITGNTLYIVDFIKGKTWRNLQRNPFISLTVMDRNNLRDYQLNGTAEILEKGNEYHQLVEEFSEKQVRFATNRVIEGVRRIKTHDSFALPFPAQVIILKIKVDEVIDIGPTVELMNNKKIVFDEKQNSSVPGILSCFAKKAKHYLSKHSNSTFLVGLFLVLLIGVIDYLTGYEIGVSIFYLIPIIMVVWCLGKKVGFFIIIASVITWIVAETLARGMAFPFLIIFWNATIRLGFFLIVAYLLYTLKIRLEKEEEFSTHDFLTGAINSRCFFELVQSELRRMSREHSVFTLVYLDVDNFKMVNDNEGHRAGDVLLQLIDSVIKNSVREIGYP